MLSVHIMNPTTSFGQPSAASVDIDDSTAAAPDMSIFIDAWLASLGLRLMPPESYMIPLPTIASLRRSASALRRVRQLDQARLLGAAGVDAEQSAAAELASSAWSNTSTPSPDAAAISVARSAISGRGEVARRRVRQIAGELRGAGRRPAAGDAALDGRTVGVGATSVRVSTGATSPLFFSAPKR